NTAPLPFGMPRTPSNLVQFQVTDLAGLTGAATYVVRGPLNITGPSSASLADTSHTFTASVNLLTGTVVSPITYTWQATGQPLVARRSGLSDTMIFTWTIPGPKTITVTATNEIRAIGSAIHDFTIEECVYLPLVMRDWSPQGSLRLPPSSFPLFTTRHF
ncbi:MAG: hypothetical protein SXV54_06925, partial [Chloroflexota bacterium]|nr:hypothetical protein [Chloroflexota bacterium]